MSENRIPPAPDARGPAVATPDPRATAREQQGPRRALWRHPAFRRLWAADAGISLARQSSQVVVPLIGAITLNASPFEMGILGAAATAPSLLISLIAGVWVDRLPRRTMMIVASAMRCALAGSIPVLWWFDTLSVWGLVSIVFASGTVTLFFDLGHLAWLPSIAGRPRLAEANGRIEASKSVAQMAGPAVGGGLAGVAVPPLAMLIDAPASLAAAWFTSGIPTDQRATSRTVDRQSIWRQAFEGLRMSLRHRVLRATIVASGVNNLFSHVFLAVYVLYMATSLDLSSFEIGMVFAIGGFGAVIGSFMAAPIARRFGVGPTVTMAWLLFGLGGLPIPLAILVPDYALALVIASEFFQWLVLPIAEVNQRSLQQAITPDQFLGRVAASHRFVVFGMIPVGSLFGGVLGSLVGLQATLLIGVAGMLGAFVWIALSPVRAIGEAPAEPLKMETATGG